MNQKWTIQPLEKGASALEHDWKNRWRTFLSQFILHCDQGKDCDGCRADMDAVIESIRKERVSCFTAGEKAGIESMISALRGSSKVLSLQELKIVSMRFGFTDGIYRTLQEVGREFGATRERIRQIEAKALERLRMTALGTYTSDNK